MMRVPVHISRRGTAPLPFKRGRFRFSPVLRWITLLSLPILNTTGSLAAHEIIATLSPAKNAVVMEIEYGDGEKFSYETYEVFPPPGPRGESPPPFQTGRTDSLGRIVFLPDRPGIWRVRYQSFDGHGGETTVNVDEVSGMSTKESRSPYERFQKALTGVGFILGIAGFLSLYLAIVQKKKMRAAS